MASVCVWLAATASPLRGQVTPEEHAKHHPDQAQQPTTAPTDMTPPAGVGPQGGMGDMAKMMEGMGTPPKKVIYPSLMNMPEFKPEKRSEISARADERMKSGTALMSEGLDRAARAASGNDFGAMQEATAKMREGLAQFESGIAAHRAIAEGKPPRDVALQ